MIILDDDVILKRIPATEDKEIFKFDWKNFKLFKGTDEEVVLTEDDFNN